MNQLRAELQQAAQVREGTKSLLVLTRDYSSASGGTGREKMVAQMLQAISSVSEVSVFRISSLTEAWSFRRCVEVLMHWLRGLISLRLVPLQVALFRDGRRIRELLCLVRRERAVTIYFDGIRCSEYLQAVRREFPNLNLVCDLDDLMSRRMALLRRSNLGISAGYLSKLTPNWVQQYVLSGWLGQLVIRYEQRALEGAELRVVEQCNSAVLAASSDAECLKDRVNAAFRKRIKVIPPATKILCRVAVPQSPLRFIFLGSDSLTQNRLTIDWLLWVWRSFSPTTPLHIYGRMNRRYDAPCNVHFEGFAESLDEVYTQNSVLLAPAFLGGGVKTKVLEGLANGTIVVGNETAFEGLGIDAERLAYSSEGILDIIKSPSSHVESLASACAVLQEQIRASFHPTLVRESWWSAMQVEPSSQYKRNERSDRRSDRVGLITVTYNSGKVIVDFLRSVLQQDYEEVVLFVVDNASSDDTLTLVRQYDDQRIRLIESGANVGFAAGCNIGIKAALESGCTHVLLINNDTVFDAQLVSGLLRAADEFGAELVVPKIVYFGERDRIWAAGGGFNRFRGFASFHFGEDERDVGQFDFARRVEFAPGCCVLIRLDVIEKLGYLDPRYFVYTEDADYCWRAKSLGIDVWYTPAVVIEHKVSSLTGGAGSPFFTQYTTRNRVLFLRKNFSWPVAAIWLLGFQTLIHWRFLSTHDSWSTYRLKQRAFWEGFTVDLSDGIGSS